MNENLVLHVDAFVRNNPDILILDNVCGGCDYYSNKLMNHLSLFGAQRIYVIGHTSIFKNRCVDLGEYPNPDRDAYHSAVKVGSVVLDPTWRQFDTACTDIVSVFKFEKYIHDWIYFGYEYADVLKLHSKDISKRRKEREVHNVC